MSVLMRKDVLSRRSFKLQTLQIQIFEGFILLCRAHWIRTIAPLAPYAMFQTPHAAKTDILLERNKCYDPNSCKDHYCLIITPESAHVIILIVIRQTDKHPNYGYPIY